MTFLRKNLGKPFLPPVVSDTDLSLPDLESFVTVSLEHRRIWATSSVVRTSFGPSAQKETNPELFRLVLLESRAVLEVIAPLITGLSGRDC